MPLSLWTYASKHHAMAINIVKQLNGNDPPWTLRFDNGFLGRQLPFGCLLFFWEGKYEPKRGKFAPNAKRGVFLGYNIQAGPVTWKRHQTSSSRRERELPVLHQKQPKATVILSKNGDCVTLGYRLNSNEPLWGEQGRLKRNSRKTL